jgi:MerR family transcriptional regulator, activator of bmr gene
LKKNLFTIGEVSGIKGITKKALRFYEKIGLLKPRFTNPENGYRFYSWEQFVAMDIIKAMRVMDISPLVIKTVMEKRDIGGLLRFLDTEKANAARVIDELEKTMETIDEVQESIRSSLSSVSHKGVYRKSIAERAVVTLPFEGIADAGDAAVAYAKFDGLIEKHGLVNAFETGVLLEEGEKGFVPAQIFNAVRVHGGSDASATSVLPAGEYACIWYTEKKAVEGGAEISRYCAKNGLAPLLVLQVDLLNDIFSTDSPAVELQLLVEGKRRPRNAAEYRSRAREP